MSEERLTFESFSSHFDNEDECIRTLIEVKWPDGFRCSRCEHRHAYLISTRRLPLFECSACRTQTSLIAGTVMEGSRTPLRLWFQAIYLHTRPEGINALQLSHAIRVTYKTAWLMCHKIRRAMSDSDSETLLTGLVYVSDAVLCSRYIAHLDWHEQEQSVLIGASENEEKEITHIKIKKQSKQLLRSYFASPEVAPFIHEHVDPDAATRTIITRRIGKTINKTLLRIAREAESWLAWTFRGIGPKHLQVYLDQFCYIWNRREQPMQHRQLLQKCAVTPAITYPELTRRQVIRSRRPSRHSKSPSMQAV